MFSSIVIIGPLVICGIIWLLTKEARRECYMECCVPNNHRYTYYN